MDFIADVLGLQLPTLRARDALRHSQYSTKMHPQPQWMQGSNNKIVWGKDYCQDLWDLPPKSKCDDDETASTLSDSDDASISSHSSLSSGCSVSFAAPLVTEVHLRPYTARNERQELFYTEADFRQFRMDFRRSLCEQKRPTVRFSDVIVSHTLPAVENKEDVYYSATELKQ
jgi:hypothetical protein